MYKIFRYKKSIIEDLVPLILTISIFIVVILIFHINNLNKKNEVNIDIKERVSSIKAEQKLLDFLEKKVEIDKENISITDLLITYYYEKSHEDILVKEIEGMLDSLSKPVAASGWNLNIYIMPEDEAILNIVQYNVLGWFKKESITTYLPLPNNPEKNLRLNLWLECQC